MKEIICQSNEVAQYIKSIILKYAPYVDSRLELFDMGSNQPAIKTEITITEEESYILFCYGTNYSWSSVDDRATIKKRIDFEEIKSVIDFILKDYRIIRNITFQNDDGYGSKIELQFIINWTEESIKKGINCGDITLELIFSNEKIRKYYTSMLLQQYPEELKKTRTVEKIKDRYIESIKDEYIEHASKEDMINLLCKLDLIELKELLYDMNNDLFMKGLIIDSEEQNINKDNSKRLKIDLSLK